MPEANKTSAFINYLHSLRDREDRGALAALRRGLGKPPGTVFSMAPYVEPWVAKSSDRDRRLYYLVATLFASHPGVKRTTIGEEESTDRYQRNMGDVFASVARADKRPDEKYEDSVRRTERRFVALLNADSEDFPQHLRHAVSLAKSKGVGVDFAALLSDLRAWDSDSRWVQQRWAASFWGNRSLEVPETTDTQLDMEKMEE